MKVDTLTAGLGVVVATLDSCGLFNHDPDSNNLFPADITLNQLEAHLQAAYLPYMRIAALLRHYIYNEPLPDIWESDWEFTRLA